MPTVRVQWANLSPGPKAASLLVPLMVILAALGVDLRAGATMAVFVLGILAATVVYVKNRTDRHNAAVERGEIPAMADPHFRPAGHDELPPGALERIDGMVDDPRGVGRVARFDGGWIVRRRNPRDVALVIGDDGGWARFDPRTVTDLWAVREYLAGRGRDG
ncbi:MAG TPA: hypothetical protein VFH58_16765 [Acidimicrobiales bacterium]|nr:hypothetical protein [Acidimicrobiales bacterium]